MITGTRRNENPDEIGVSQSDASFCCQWSAMMQWLVVRRSSHQKKIEWFLHASYYL